MAVGLIACSALLLIPDFGQARQKSAASRSVLAMTQAGHRKGPAKVFESVLPRVKEKTKLPVLLPSDLPQPLGKAKYSVIQAVRADDYEISLYYELGIGDAGFAAFFSGQAHANYRPEELGDIQEVKLARETRGFFMPVSCGGSCAPANLWWVDNEVLYLIQLKLPSTLNEREQEKEIVAVVDSAIIAGPR